MVSTPPGSATGSNAVRAGRSSRRRWSTLVPVSALVGLSVIAAACSSAAPTSAAPTVSPAAGAKAHAHHAGGRTGVVTGVTPTQLTITTKGSTSTYLITSSTTFQEAGAPVAASAVAPGDHVRIRLVKSAAPATAATAATVVVLPPTVSGTVGTLSPSGFTVASRGGVTHSVVTSSATVFHSGKQTVSASVLHDGEHVRVTGSTLANGSTAATTVRLLPAKKR